MSTPEATSGRSSRLGQGALALSVVAIAVSIVIGILEQLGVGLGEPGAVAPGLSQQIIDVAVTHEDWYLRYGRWIDLTSAVAFAGILVAIPFVRGTRRALHVLIAGGTLAIAGEVIDLSQLGGIDLARWTLESGLAADFTAANTYRYAINGTASFVWSAGLFLTSVGIFIVANDADDRRWKALNALFAVSLLGTGVADLSGSLLWLDIVSYAMAALALVWITLALGRLDDRSVLGPPGEPRLEPAHP
ncbi:MAG TPA: hypothetical protein VK088_10545 [Acidimicrobiia bacterium]|nr:hypothetical protein [Acidimicrobiia bacterium]